MHSYETSDDILEGEVNKFFSESRAKESVLNSDLPFDSIVMYNGEKLVDSGVFLQGRNVNFSGVGVCLGHLEIDSQGNKFTWPSRSNGIEIDLTGHKYIFMQGALLFGSYYTLVIKHGDNNTKLIFDDKFLFPDSDAALSEKQGSVDILQFYCNGFNMFCIGKFLNYGVQNDQG